MLEKKTKYFTFKQYNSPFEDPHLLIKDMRSPISILLDLGDIKNIPHKEILRVRYIFITHYHMDHFIGFADLIRSFLTERKETSLHFFGPSGLKKHISNIIAGFTWNLLDDNIFKISITEIHKNIIELTEPITFYQLPFHKTHTTISAYPNNTILINPHYSIKYIWLDHKIPILGYQLNTNSEIHFNNKNSPFIAGKWIKLFKENINNNIHPEYYNIDDEKISANLLKDFFITEPAKTYTYLTDFIYNKNDAELNSFIKETDILFIENHFMPEDALLARKTHHLSSLDIKDIIEKNKPKEVILFHFSRRYISKYSVNDFYKNMYS